MSFANMPLYTGDYFRDTRHLTPEEHGCYMLLLMHCWDSKGPVPLDERRQYGLVNARSGGEIESLRRVLVEFFVKMEDGWYNPRMVKEIAKWESISQARSKGGLEKARRQRNDVAAHRARAVLEQCSSSAQAVVEQVTPTPTPTLTSTPTPTPTLSPPPTPKVKNTARSKPLRPAEPDAPTAKTWEAYSDAYLVRYDVRPVRNAKVNAMLKNLLARLGAEAAPLVAAFYVLHNRQQYVTAKHTVDLLVRDCEGLHTDWQRGLQTTDASARLLDRRQTNLNAFAPLLAAAEREEKGHGK